MFFCSASFIIIRIIIYYDFVTFIYRLKIATTEPPQVVTRAQFLARADTAPKSSQSAPFVGVKPFRRTSSPKMSRPSSVQREYVLKTDF